jgi:probable rRNA maturation factor
VILVEADLSEEWDSSTGWRELAERGVRAAIAASHNSGLATAGLAVEVSVKFTGDDEVQSLNASWRGKDKATNVLSFPMVEADLLPALAASQGREAMLGDVVLAHGVCTREAAEKGVSVADHAAHLVVHGTLHLLGYDHEQGDEAAEAMEKIERAALAEIGIADPYRVHG